MSKTKAHVKYKNSKGQVIPGVTTVLKQLGWSTRALIAWARREALAGNDPDKIRDKAADIGTLCHYMIECHCKGVEPDLTEYSPANIAQAENGFLAFLDWEKINKPTYLENEIQVISEEYQYGGTIDIIADLHGKKTLLDLKTSNGIYDEMYVQVSAYMTAYNETANEPIEDACILQISKVDASFAFFDIAADKLYTAWQVFQHCLWLQKLQRQMKEGNSI